MPPPPDPGMVISDHTFPVERPASPPALDSVDDSTAEVIMEMWKNSNEDHWSAVMPYPSESPKQLSETPGRESVQYKGRERAFFRVGRVFLMIWAPVSESIPSLIRNFVVIREGRNMISALPIQSYRGAWIAGTQLKKTNHAMIYTGKYRARALSEEKEDHPLSEGIPTGRTGNPPYLALSYTWGTDEEKNKQVLGPRMKSTPKTNWWQRLWATSGIPHIEHSAHFGCDVCNRQSQDGEYLTPFSVTSQWAHTKIVELPLEKSIDVDKQARTRRMSPDRAWWSWTSDLEYNRCSRIEDRKLFEKHFYRRIYVLVGTWRQSLKFVAAIIAVQTTCIMYRYMDARKLSLGIGERGGDSRNGVAPGFMSLTSQISQALHGYQPLWARDPMPMTFAGASIVTTLLLVLYHRLNLRHRYQNLVLLGCVTCGTITSLISGTSFLTSSVYVPPGTIFLGLLISDLLHCFWGASETETILLIEDKLSNPDDGHAMPKQDRNSSGAEKDAVNATLDTPREASTGNQLEAQDSQARVLPPAYSPVTLI